MWWAVSSTITDGRQGGRAQPAAPVPYAVLNQATRAGLFNLPMVLGMAVIATEIVFLSFFAPAGIEFILSSAALTAALLIQLRFGLRRHVDTPADLVVFIFNWLFLDLAPKIQLISLPRELVNTSSVAPDRVAVTNLACSLFIITFTLIYSWMGRRWQRSMPAIEESAVAQAPRPFTAEGVGIAIAVCLVMVAVAAPYAYRSVDTVATASPLLLIVSRCLLFMPSATLLILLNETVRRRQGILFTRACALVLLVLLVMITENPYTEKRNALGPVYIGMLLIAFQGWFAVGWRRLGLLVFSMVLHFPSKHGVHAQS